MVAGKVFENCYKFNPNRAKHASNHAKKYKYSSQKDHFHGKIITCILCIPPGYATVSWYSLFRTFRTVLKRCT
jgi:hypothetical protein